MSDLARLEISGKVVFSRERQRSFQRKRQISSPVDSNTFWVEFNQLFTISDIGSHGSRRVVFHGRKLNYGQFPKNLIDFYEFCKNQKKIEKNGKEIIKNFG